MPELRDATVLIGIPGLNGGDVTNAEFTTLETRVTTLEGNTPPAVLDDLTDVDTTTDAPASGDLLEFDGTNWVPATPGTTTVTFALPVVIGDSVSVIGTGPKADILIPFAATITGYTILPDVSGSIDVEVNADTYANYPPTVADNLLHCTLTSATKAQTTGLSIAVASGRILRFNVGSATTVKRVSLTLTMTREI
jgi:hypothetical protein